MQPALGYGRDDRRHAVGDAPMPGHVQGRLLDFSGSASAWLCWSLDLDHLSAQIMRHGFIPSEVSIHVASGIGVTGIPTCLPGTDLDGGGARLAHPGSIQCANLLRQQRCREDPDRSHRDGSCCDHRGAVSLCDLQVIGVVDIKTHDLIAFRWAVPTFGLTADDHIRSPRLGQQFLVQALRPRQARQQPHTLSINHRQATR